MGLIASSDGIGLNVHRTTGLLAAPTAVKGMNARLYGVEIQNPSGAEAFVHLYDALSGAVTVGTTVPKLTYWVPTAAGKDKVYPTPIAFNTGMAIAATTTLGGTTAPGSGLLVQLEYK